MISITQFDGQHTESDVAAMNAKVADVLSHFDIATADLSDRERAEIAKAVENEVSGRFDTAAGDCPGDFDNLMPGQWRSLIASRAK